MQVHAVPDSERVYDSTGRRLPWGFELPDMESSQRRIPEEKGPFGKARKRGTSRSKTPNVSSAHDQAKQENIRAIDDIFARLKADTDKQKSQSVRKAPSSQPSASTSTPNLGDGGGMSASFQGAVNGSALKEPTEVLLYGFGNEVQWAAISQYEKISGGMIFEQYEREPNGQRFGLSFSTFRNSVYSSLSKSAIAKVNEWVGGEHWIKVTFESPEAAERACHYSPQTIQGYTVYAESYRGTGPTGGDRAIHAGVASTATSPNTLSSATIPLPPSQSSATASSATVTAPPPPFQLTQPSGAYIWDDPAPAPVLESSSQQALDRSTTGRSSSSQLQGVSRATLRIKNAKPAVFLPPEKAFLPAPPMWQQTLRQFPVIGWIIGSGHGIIGDHVPRKDDGTFDSASASLYWKCWYMIDSCFGTDFCAVREAETDE